ncbi:unnamed protein product, partial [Didymodactylos carnosus]
DRGYCYYSGGNGKQTNGQTDNGISNMSQFINLTAYSKGIDQQLLSFTVSAFLGGVGEQKDDAKVIVDFMDKDYHKIASLQIGPVSASDRQNKTSMLYRTNTGKIKSLTRYANVYLVMTRQSDVNKYGTNNDGNADNILFMITQTGE